MDYFLKASAILGIFYLFYKFLLERETFFQSNRMFLLTGIIVAMLLPLLVIPIYIEQGATTLSTISFSTSQEIIGVEKSFDWMLLIQFIYIGGVVLFGTRFLFSLFSLSMHIITGRKEKIDNSYYIKSDNDIAPFSFFNFIIYNPISFKQTELQQILTHEKVHANQWHSFDVVLAQLLTIIFWFNPFSWLYQKDIKQNLEFIADAVSQEQSDCQKSYQKLLLKTSISKNQLALTNNFYNSLIKKRIIMLHKIRSKNRNQWKFALIVPFLMAFIVTFNTKMVAQKPVIKEIQEVEENESKDHKQLVELREVNSNIEVFLITKDSKDLDKIKIELNQKGITAKFKEIKRNSVGEITSIHVALKSKKSNANFSMSSDTPIKPIKISFNTDGSKLSIGNVTRHDNLHKKGTKRELHEVREIQEVREVQKVQEIQEVEQPKKQLHEVIEIEQSGPKSEIIEIKTTPSSDSDNAILELKKNNLMIEWEDGENNPLVIVNGKETPYKKMEDLDSKTIESMNILKGESATKEYGEKGKNGVVEIRTKI